MPWIYAVLGLVIGAILGVVIARLTTPNYKKQKSTQKELDSTKFQLEQQRQELADHFAQTAELLDTLGKDYTKLYQHMVKTSGDLLPEQPEQDNPFAKKLAEYTVPAEEKSDYLDEVLDEAPKDYANGSTGLLKEEQKQILHSDEVVTAKAS